MTHLLFALFLFQADTGTPVPEPASGSALMEMLRNSGPIALTVLGNLGDMHIDRAALAC